MSKTLTELFSENPIQKLGRVFDFLSANQNDLVPEDKDVFDGMMKMHDAGITLHREALLSEKECRNGMAIKCALEDCADQEAKRRDTERRERGRNRRR